MNIVKFGQPLDKGRHSKINLAGPEVVVHVLFTSMFISQKSHVVLLVGLVLK